MSQPTWRARLLLQVLKTSRFGTLNLRLPGGRTVAYGSGEPQLHVEFKDWKSIDDTYRRGDIGMADAIMRGTLIIKDEALLVEWACKNADSNRRVLDGAWWGNIVAKIRHMFNRNSREGARRNIMAHYDLGNEFYKLWLDSTMTYSAGIFADTTTSLGDAQRAKFDRIISTLGITATDHVLEIGCGWGGFFSHAVEKTGCRVAAVSNSPAMIAYNKKLVSDRGIGERVTLLQADYRDITGTYDKVVSIEMIEAVGDQYWDAFFGKVSSSLKAGGQALIQGIISRKGLFDEYRRGTDFIQRYIFPGGMLLTNIIFSRESSDHGMSVKDVFHFGQDYARTLRIWRAGFDDHRTEVKALGFDDPFIRLWRLYLAYCEGAFRAGRIDVGQFLLSKN